MLKRIKTAYEIAMENADKITEEDDGKTDKLVKKEEIRPIMADFFKDKLDAEGLWEEIREKEGEDYVTQAQELILDSLGMRTTSDGFEKRKRGVMALESLKEQKNTNIIEQMLNKISELQDQYQNQKESLEERYKQRIEQQSQAQMKPDQTEDGQTVMNMGSSMDREAKQQMAQQLSQLEERSEQIHNGLIEEIKDNL
jgi:hypothetical protein